ncbi:hypothetical protein C2G38_2041226 [Gigaspora rosea]|uniref:Uncharacterized protein n=1 Tax=Gigaspora rosea TaxID=44941 RepID=A0A397USH5_9GLOM|nr:hypothetical protein C2G38_2041226 [Gigaspora rosea]
MIFYNEEGALNLDLNSRTLFPVRKPATIPVTASITGAVQKRHQYGRIWGLAVDTSDKEIIQILNKYISKKKKQVQNSITDQLSNYSTNDLDNERIEESDSNTIETSTSSPANDLDHERIEESDSNIVKTSTSSPDIETLYLKPCHRDIYPKPCRYSKSLLCC